MGYAVAIVQDAVAPANRKVPGAIWLRGDSLTQSGGNVVTWVDKFGNWPAATVLNAAPAYTAQSATFASRAAATFTHASNQCLQVATFSQAQADTIYAIVKNTQASGTVYDGLTTRQVLTLTAGSAWEYFAGTLQPSAITTPGPHIVCVTFNGISSAMYIDNSVTAVITGQSGAGVLANLGIGNSTGTASGMTGDFAEFLCTPGSDSAAQRAAMFAYANVYYSQPTWA